MRKKYQFFVSSTYKDLIEERQIAINSIMRLGHIPAGMELFTATGEEQFASIKPIIDESDYYVLILGGKYGTVIKSEKISYTEKEFDYAISTGKRIIALVHKDPDNLPSNKRETKASMIKYFNNFREKVINDRMVSMWSNLVDLSQLISSSIVHVVDNLPSPTYWVHINNNTIISKSDDMILGKIEYIDIFSSEQCIPYYRGIPENMFTYYSDKNNNTINLKGNFSSLDKNHNEFKWAGLCIRNLPCRDWRKYILNGSLLKFSAVATSNVKSIWFEIKSDRIEMCKKKIEFDSNVEKEIFVDLGKFGPTINDWEWVREICFVIYPEHIGQGDIKIKISDLRIES